MECPGLHNSERNSQCLIAHQVTNLFFVDNTLKSQSKPSLVLAHTYFSNQPLLYLLTAVPVVTIMQNRKSPWSVWGNWQCQDSGSAWGCYVWAGSPAQHSSVHWDSIPRARLLDRISSINIATFSFKKWENSAATVLSQIPSNFH